MWDSGYRFTFFSAKCSGPAHCSVAFSVSSYSENLRQCKLPDVYWIAGDDGYICDENIIMLLPSQRCLPGSSDDAFSYFKSSHRMQIEHSFEIMVAGWGILWNLLRYSLAQNFLIVNFSICIHDFCINNGDNNVRDIIEEYNFD